MRFLSSVIAPALLASTAYGTALQDHADAFMKSLRRDRNVHVRSPVIEPPQFSKRAPTHLTAKSKPFAVNGTNIPDVPFDIGESYAGLLPISNKTNETSKLYFWYFPSPNPEGAKKLTVFFNGGPGCSSLHGLLTEFGPFTWQDGTEAPVYNPYSWVNLTGVVWVEQPVGVGFSQGVPTIRNEVDLGNQYIGFHKNFVDTFDLHGYDTYIAGESYAGMYVGYVADAFVLAKNNTYYNLKGVHINDALIGDRTIQQNGAISPYVDYWDNLFYLNETFKAQMHKAHKDCGFEDYMNKYLRFPPPQQAFQLPKQLQNKSLNCDMYDTVADAITLVNPCFKVWHITEMCPQKSEQLGKVFPYDYEPPNQKIYFNRTDVQKAINAPVGTNWLQCATINVFGGPSNNPNLSDTSISPGNDGVLQRVIEHTNNVFFGSGDQDYILNTNSTLLAIQNITWNGKRGLSKFPNNTLYSPYHVEYSGGAKAGSGVLGTWGKDRGVTFYRVQLSGHELPGYASGASYRVVEVMTGKTANLSVVGNFYTQKNGNFGNGNGKGKRDEL